MNESQLELSLFAHAHARQSDPDTSKRAAALASMRAGSHKDQIMTALHYASRNRMGPQTFEQVAKLTGLRESACWKRLSDLLREELVRVVDDDGKTIQGASCSRYEVVRDGWGS